MPTLNSISFVVVVLNYKINEHKARHVVRKNKQNNLVNFWFCKYKYFGNSASPAGVWWEKIDCLVLDNRSGSIITSLEDGHHSKVECFLMLEYFCVLPFFRCCQDGSQEKEANSPWNLVSNVSYLPSCASWSDPPPKHAAAFFCHLELTQDILLFANIFMITAVK